MREGAQPIESLPPWRPSTAQAAVAASNNAAAQESLSSAAKAFQTDNVYQIYGWRYWLIFLPLASLVRLYYSTLRFEIDAEEESQLRDQSRPVLFVTWHNRSLVAPYVFCRFRMPERLIALVSPSKAAAWEARFFEMLRINCARGSSSRRSIQATRELLRANAQGYDIGLTPDGPSGPLYSAKRGVLMMARKTRSPLLLFGASHKRAWRLNTWDRHFVPLPFAKIRLRARMVESEEIFGDDYSADDAEAAERLRKHMLELNPDHF